MYVCICHAVTDRQIRAAIRDGARHAAQLQDRLKVATGCGSCSQSVAECLARELGGELAKAVA